MALPETLWLPSTALGKVDGENYRAFVIEKAHLPVPENQSGSKRLIVESMASVGINVDVTDIVYAPAPGDTRAGFVTIHLIAQVTDSAQLNSKKVWASHPLGRTEAVALPEIGFFTIGGLTAPAAAAGSADSKSSSADANMGDGVATEVAEPPSKQSKTSGSVGAPVGAEADDYDSSDEPEIRAVTKTPLGS